MKIASSTAPRANEILNSAEMTKIGSKVHLNKKAARWAA